MRKAAPVENPGLTNEVARQELEAAAQIQQGLMAVTVPDPSFAAIAGRNLPCREIGGDFFLTLTVGESVNVAIADVSGKGIAAAVMASALQGMMHEALLHKVPLSKIATDANTFFAVRDVGSKYATCVIIRLDPDGKMEYLNCGHIQPLVVRAGKVIPLVNSNLPIGLLECVEYESEKFRLLPGDRIVLVTDGVTEAEGSEGDFFGAERLKESVAAGMHPEDIFRSVARFCGDRPLADDCTIVGLHYKGD